MDGDTLDVGYHNWMRCCFVRGLRLQWLVGELGAVKRGVICRDNGADVFGIGSNNLLREKDLNYGSGMMKGAGVVRTDA